MNAYLDTSALVKLYVAEAGADAVRALVAQADAVATSSLAYAEARAAFARRVREGSLADAAAARVVAALDRDWDRLVTIEARGPLCRAAGSLAERHALRGFDAIHLASALELAALLGAPPVFACFDEALSHAAAAEGFQVA